MNLSFYFLNFLVFFNTIHKKKLPCFGYKPYMDVQIYENISIFLLQNLEPILKLNHFLKNSFYFFLIKNPFVDVDGPFLCLQNGGNSPKKLT